MYISYETSMEVITSLMFENNATIYIMIYNLKFQMNYLKYE